MSWRVTKNHEMEMMTECVESLERKLRDTLEQLQQERRKMDLVKVQLVRAERITKRVDEVAA